MVNKLTCKTNANCDGLLLFLLLLLYCEVIIIKGADVKDVVDCCVQNIKYFYLVPERLRSVVLSVVICQRRESVYWLVVVVVN